MEGQQASEPIRPQESRPANPEVQRNLVGEGMNAVRTLDERAKTTSREDNEFAGTVENGVGVFDGARRSMPIREQERIEGVVRLKRVSETVEGIKRDAGFLGLGTADLVPEVERLFREALAASDSQTAEAKLAELKARFSQKLGVLRNAKSYQVERGEIIGKDVLENDQEIQRSKADIDRAKAQDGKQAQSFPELGTIVAASKEFRAGVSGALDKHRESGRRFEDESSIQAQIFHSAVDRLAASLQSPKSFDSPAK